MATLVSPGVSVTVTDQSYFIPASAPTVPLIVLATQDNKPQDPTNPNSPIAPGTQEYGVVRTITSLSQSQSTYGVPVFRTTNGLPNHGDARNEYGLATLNRFLGQGSVAYAIRANVNLDDNFSDLQSFWTNDIDVATQVLESLVTQWIAQYNSNNLLTPQTPSTPGSTTVGYKGLLTSSTAITGGIETLGTPNGGTGYLSTSTYQNVPLTGGHGSGALATVTISGGSVSAVTITNPGYGYVANDQLSAKATSLGATSSITTLGTFTGGAGYTDGTYNNVPLTGSATGTSATANITVSGGVVTDVVLANGGVNYSTTDILTAAIGTTGTGFTVQVSAITNPTTAFYVDVLSVTSQTPAQYVANVVIDTHTIPVSIDLSTISNVGAFITALNAALGSNGTATLTNGNIVIASSTVGTTSTVTVTDVNTTGVVTTSGLGTIVGGTNYTNGTYPNVPLTGGSGLGAMATVTVSGGSVTSVVITAGGSGYVANTDTLSANSSNLGGTGLGFSVPVTSVASINGLFHSVSETNFVGFTTAAGTNGYRVTIDHTSLYALIQQAMAFVWQQYSFGIATTPTTLQQDFMNDQTASPFTVYANGFNQPSTGTFIGILGGLTQWYNNDEGSVVAGEFTATEAGNFLTSFGDDFEWTDNFLFKTALGTDDASRRAAIVQALTAIVNSNEDIRTETFEYNLILCPGYPEVASAMQALVINYLNSEVLVIGDTPMNVDMSGSQTSLQQWAGSTARVIDIAGNVTYYYPHILTTNLDGSTILLPSSAQALTTMAFSDSVSYEWFAPAGLKRGAISGIEDLGYVDPTSVLGTATTFVSLHPNQGQRDTMYAYTAQGGINPLAFFPGNGFVVWGQKTSTGTTATSLDRVNVSRLVKYIARSLRKAALAFVFEPNDTLTQNNLKAMVDSFLGTLVTKRGLYDFASICDSSNNTPAVVDANQLICDVALKPVKAAEFIYIPITIVATGANLTSGGAAQSAG